MCSSDLAEIERVSPVAADGAGEPDRVLLVRRSIGAPRASQGSLLGRRHCRTGVENGGPSGCGVNRDKGPRQYRPHDDRGRQQTSDDESRHSEPSSVLPGSGQVPAFEIEEGAQGIGGDPEQPAPRSGQYIWHNAEVRCDPASLADIRSRFSALQAKVQSLRKEAEDL